MARLFPSLRKFVPFPQGDGTRLESAWHPLAIRKGLAEFCKSAASALEIGPFFRPVLSGSHVKYFDVLDKAQLVQRAESFGKSTANVPEIDYVSATGDLGIVDEAFDVAFSAHCIEHQPDLIRHLQQVGAILKPGGHYALVIPDKRYCFDHFLGETNIAELIAAHQAGQRLHGLASVIEHRALVTHNRAKDHWRGKHGKLDLDDCAGKIRNAMAEYAANPNGYIDVHAWQFTPQSFLDQMRLLHKLGLSPFTHHRVFATGRGKIEFTAILQRGP